MESHDFARSALECGDSRHAVALREGWLAPLFRINQREIAAQKYLRKLRRLSSDGSTQIPH
jgi:hypothetical protein